MEGVNTFLESSTIHGLSHISSTRKYAKLFWMFVVITGFSVASILIKATTKKLVTLMSPAVTLMSPVVTLMSPAVTLMSPAVTCHEVTLL